MFKNSESVNGNENLSQCKNTNIPPDGCTNSSLRLDGTNNDSYLEAESTSTPAKQIVNLMTANELDKMVNDCLKNNEDDNEDDAENDTDLLEELQSIVDGSADHLTENNVETKSSSLTNDQVTINILKERIEMYNQAEANAQAAGNNAKLRRLQRGLKTLHDLLRQANSGQAINLDDIPQQVSLKQPAADGKTLEDDDNCVTSTELPNIPNEEET